jgi:hypothetical protein
LEQKYENCSNGTLFIRTKINHREQISIKNPFKQNAKIVPMKHIVDLEQIMRSNDVEHNFLGTSYKNCSSGTHMLGNKIDSK